jgi:hypothetical protein
MEGPYDIMPAPKWDGLPDMPCARGKGMRDMMRRDESAVCFRRCCRTHALARAAAGKTQAQCQAAQYQQPRRRLGDGLEQYVVVLVPPAGP